MGEEITWEVAAERRTESVKTQSCPTKDEALLWVSDYQAAWETKDFGRLRALGVIVSSAQEAAIRNDLVGRRQYRVQVSNLSVTNDGCRVAFDRSDGDAAGARAGR